MEPAGAADALLAGSLLTSVDLVVVADASGRCVAASEAVSRLIGRRPEDLVGTAVETWFAPDDLDTIRFLGRRLRKEGSARATVRVRLADNDVVVWLDVAAERRDESPGQIVLSARDITEEILALQQVQQSEQQWRLSFDHSPIGAAILDEDLRIHVVNDTFAQMLGHRAGHLLHRHLPEFLVGGQQAFDQTMRERFLAGSQDREFDLQLLAADGSVVWGQATVADVPVSEADAQRRLVVQVLDATERRQAELELANRALHDALTGLPNRNLVHQWLASALDEHLGGEVGVLYCDLDRFKIVNDSLGHAVGDDLLVEVAARLTNAVRPDDFVGRIGGDEFVVVLERLTDPTDLLAVAQRIVGAFDEPFFLAGHQHSITPSIGAAVGSSPDGPDEILMRADLALLRAKRAGRHRFEVFDERLDRVTTVADLEFEAQLRRSVDAEELAAFYQSVVDLASGERIGAEALLRWRHPQLGLLAPEAFLPLAENSGMIRNLGWWILFRACHEAAAGTLGPGWVSVNVSPVQLNRPGFAAIVRDAVDASGLSPTRLHLEITETALLEAGPHVVDELRALRRDGVGIVLDDFGTGYSSLSLLRDLPVTTVKIDRSFVAPLLSDQSTAAIVRAVLVMCADLGLPTIAEGVESEEQLEALRRFGCTHAQGFLFDRPAPATRIEALA